MPPKKSVSFKRRNRRYKAKYGKYAKKNIAAAKIQGAFKRYKKRGAKSILVKNNSLAVSYDHNFNRPGRFGLKMAKRFADGAPNVYKWEEANVVLANPGKQGVIEYDAFSVTQMTQMITALGLTPGAVGSILNTSRSFWTKCVEEVRMTNSSNGNLEVQLYLYNTKRDTQSSVNNLWQNGLYDETGQIVFDYRVNQGVTPFDSKAVSQFYKCYKLIRIMLAPGQSHIHRSTFHMNKIMNNEILSKQNGLLSMAGWTKPLLIVVNGLPCTSSNGLSISSSTSNLDVIRVQTYEYKYISDQDTNFVYYTQNVLSGTAGNVYNQGSGTSTTSAVI